MKHDFVELNEEELAYVTGGGFLSDLFTKITTTINNLFNGASSGSGLFGGLFKKLIGLFTGVNP